MAFWNAAKCLAKLHAYTHLFSQTHTNSHTHIHKIDNQSEVAYQQRTHNLFTKFQLCFLFLFAAQLFSAVVWFFFVASSFRFVSSSLLFFCSGVSVCLSHLRSHSHELIYAFKWNFLYFSRVCWPFIVSMMQIVCRSIEFFHARFSRLWVLLR